MDDLRGKVAVVTGAASGIGFALSERFAAEGMGVVMADVEQAALSEAAEMLRTKGADVLSVLTDVSKADQVEALAARAEEQFGAVHVVCNNAGVAGGGGPSWETALADWEWTLGVNLWGVIHGVRTFLPRMIAQGEGHMVNTASLAGLYTGGIGGPYSVSKYGVVALSESLYLSLQLQAPSIGISVLCPGWVNTRIGESDRNRPGGVDVSLKVDPMAQKARKGLLRVLEAGMAPAQVAEKVVRAIHDNVFYVLPHDDEEWIAPIRARMEDILERRNPTLHPIPGTDVIMAAMFETD